MQRLLKKILAVCHFWFLREIDAQEWNSPPIDIDGIPKGRSQLFSLPIRGPKCGYGGNYTFVVVRGENAEPNKNGKYEKVMISFSDGGICADYATCLAYEMIYDQDKYSLEDLSAILGLQLNDDDELWRGTVHRQTFAKAEVDDCKIAHLGLVPCSSAEYSDYVALALPECTGDLFLGTQTTTYPFETAYEKYYLNFDHHGALAVLAILPAFVAATGTPNNVQNLIVAGAGDGGWGALVWGGPIMEAFESTSAESVRGKLRTNVLVDSAFSAPLDDPPMLSRMFTVLKWGASAITWRDKINIEPGNFVNILKEQLTYYAGRFRVAFMSCDQGGAADLLMNYIFSNVWWKPDRIASMWNFLRDIHHYDSTLGSNSDGSDSRVFSFIGNCRYDFLAGQVRDYIKHPLRGNESALKIDNWMDTFLTTGFPYKISSDSVRVGGPSYNMQYKPKDAAALTKLKADENADRYWCCVSDLDEPGTTFQTSSFIIPDSYNHAFDDPHDFEGWNCDVITPCGNLGLVCGGAWVKGAGSEIVKTFTLPAGTYSVELDFIKMDSWDRESAYVSVNGETCWIKTGIRAIEGTQQCGGLFKEERYRVTGCYVTLPESRTMGSSLTVRVWTNLDSGPTDESFGIDNVVIQKANRPVNGGMNNKFDNQHNFEGWNCGEITRCGDMGQICGGYDVKGKGSDIVKAYILPVGNYSVELDFIKIDSWDRESAYVSVNGATCWVKNGIRARAGEQVCGGHFKEQSFRVTGCNATLPATFTGTALLTVRVWTNLDQAADDESFGIDNVVVKKIEAITTMTVTTTPTTVLTTTAAAPFTTTTTKTSSQKQPLDVTDDASPAADEIVTPIAMAASTTSEPDPITESVTAIATTTATTTTIVHTTLPGSVTVISPTILPTIKVSTAMVAPTTPEPESIEETAIKEPSGSECPTCGVDNNSGERSCCASGGSWFEKCGDPDNTNFEHTWDEGIEACGAAVPSLEQGNHGSGTTCPKCGTNKKGKLTCCAADGAWANNCGGDDSNFEHTWTEGVLACEGDASLRSNEAQMQIRMSHEKTETHFGSDSLPQIKIVNNGRFRNLSRVTAFISLLVLIF